MKLAELAGEPQNGATLEPTTADLSIDPIVKRQEAHRAAEEQARAVFAEYQKNSNATADLQAQVLKGLQAGKPLAELFLLAMEAVSLCTHCRTPYEQARADLRAIYGYGLQEPGAAGMEARAVQERIDRMTAAATSDAVPQEEKGPIQKAIVSHRKALEWLGQATQ